MERTLVLIKPDGIQRELAGTIIERFERRSLKIVGLKMIHMDEKMAKKHYGIHEGKPFYDSLTDFMSSGPCVVLVLEGKEAIKRYRDLMGATNYEEAAEGTIRREFATDIEKNAVHGSDSPESAHFEIGYFFGELEIAAT